MKCHLCFVWLVFSCLFTGQRRFNLCKCNFKSIEINCLLFTQRFNYTIWQSCDHTDHLLEKCFDMSHKCERLNRYNDFVIILYTWIAWIAFKCLKCPFRCVYCANQATTKMYTHKIFMIICFLEMQHLPSDHTHTQNVLKGIERTNPRDSGYFGTKIHQYALQCLCCGKKKKPFLRKSPEYHHFIESI